MTKQPTPVDGVALGATEPPHVPGGGAGTQGFDEGWGEWGLDPMGHVLDDDVLPRPLEIALRLFDPGPPMGFGESTPAPATPPAPASSRPRTEQFEGSVPYTRQLAEQFPVVGTPTFVITAEGRKKAISGFADVERLEAAIHELRAGG